MTNLREVYKIFEVVMFLLISFWRDDFLQFMGIDLEIKDILSVHYTTKYGKQVILDFVFQATNNRVYDLEFQHPFADDDDLDRFGFYNIILETFVKEIVETIIVNYTKKPDDNFKIVHRGFSKSFHPKQHYVGECDFKTHFRNIKKKVKTYSQSGAISKFTPIEEVAMLVRCV